MPLTKVSFAMIDGISVNVLDYGADPTGTNDSTTAIQAAFDAAISLGNTNQTPNSVYIPPGKYKVTSLTIGGIGGDAAKDAYNKTIWCDGVLEGTNASGPVLNIEGIEFCNFYNLRVSNSSTATDSRAVKISRAYTVNWYGATFSGGFYAALFQGNANTFTGCLFTGASQAGFAIIGDSSNTVANNMTASTIQNNAGWGIEVNRTSGASYADMACEDCYFENNGFGHVRIYNDLGNVSFESCFFAMSDDEVDGIVIGGTLETATGNQTRIENNQFYANTAGLKFNCVSREAGTLITDMGGIRYLGNVLNGLTNANTVLGFTQAYSGSTNGVLGNGINVERKNNTIGILNFDFTSLSGGAGSAPNNWTAGGSGTLTTGTTISPYNWGNSVISAGTVNQYPYQNVKVNPNTLYYVSCYAAVSAGTATAQLQLWDTARATQYFATNSTSSTNGALVEGYWFSGAITEVAILLRKPTDSGSATSSFAEVRMQDMSY